MLLYNAVVTSISNKKTVQPCVFLIITWKVLGLFHLHLTAIRKHITLVNILRCVENRKFALLLDRKMNLLKVFDFAWKQSVKVQHFEARYSALQKYSPLRFWLYFVIRQLLYYNCLTAQSLCVLAHVCLIIFTDLILWSCHFWTLSTTSVKAHQEYALICNPYFLQFGSGFSNFSQTSPVTN